MKSGTSLIIPRHASIAPTFLLLRRSRRSPGSTLSISSSGITRPSLFLRGKKKKEPRAALPRAGFRPTQISSALHVDLLFRCHTSIPFPPRGEEKRRPHRGPASPIALASITVDLLLRRHTSIPFPGRGEEKRARAASLRAGFRPMPVSSSPSPSSRVQGSPESFRVQDHLGSKDDPGLGI
ncbi:hypothetical protein AXF42_Ash008524 [Apostasia shenzhenica]|uniref:Uncharacterized protein n=1 Tax=Apostasia shenzhenica TaxID=1088818 RepID=A0A2I0B1P8_9ASPA|nr:hypothetical protein AXF42_Ash008524 [Apostasia shenzhenica]